MAADPRDIVGDAESGRYQLHQRDCRDWLADRAALDVSDQPFQPVRTAADLLLLFRPRTARGEVPHAAVLPLRATPADAGVLDRLLGDAEDVAWAFVVFGGDHRLHPDG